MQILNTMFIHTFYDIRQAEIRFLKRYWVGIILSIQHTRNYPTKYVKTNKRMSFTIFYSKYISGASTMYLTQW